MELKEKTKLSSRTLAKHLDKMTNMKNVEKKVDVESGNYPYPVYYKAQPEFITYIKANMARQENASTFEQLLNEKKDPLLVLEIIHTFSRLWFIQLLKRIQQNKKMTNEEIYFFGECFLWTNYKQYVSKLIEGSRKIIDDVNINQCVINQFKREIRIAKKALKISEKRIEQQKNNHDVPRNSDDT